MRYSFFIAAIILSVAFCAEEDEYTTLYKYREACPGYVNKTDTTFGMFVEKTLSEKEGSLLNVCKTDYFTAIPESCSEEHNNCVVSIYFWEVIV